MLAVRTHLSTAESCSETRQKRRGGHPVPGPWSSTVDPSSHRPPKVFAVNCVATWSGPGVSDEGLGPPGRSEGRAPHAQKPRTGAKALRTQSAETAPTGSTNHREVGGNKSQSSPLDTVAHCGADSFFVKRWKKIAQRRFENIFCASPAMRKSRKNRARAPHDRCATCGRPHGECLLITVMTKRAACAIASECDVCCRLQPSMRMSWQL